MLTADLLKLVLLAAIWGGSFIFMRVIAPALPALPTGCLRILIGGAFLCAYYSLSRIKLPWREKFLHYTAIGMLNAGVPFSLYAYAAHSIPASYSVVLNATAPLFGALFERVIGKQKMTLKNFVALLLGLAGVAVVTNVGYVQLDQMKLYAMGACLLAAACYGASGTILKKYQNVFEPRAVASLGLLLAGIVMAPIALQNVPWENITYKVGFNLLGLSLLCSAIAFMIWFPLLRKVGASKALTVTYLMPLFGILWGKIFLNESITPQTIYGGVMILASTFFITKK